MWVSARAVAGARRRTVEGYRLDERHIARVIGAVRLDRLAPEHIDRLWATLLSNGAGPATCAHVRRTLSAALTAAVDRGHLVRNPVRLSEAPRYEPGEGEPLSELEARTVLEVAAGRPNGARWSVALALGLRQGEALGLRWEDVDLWDHLRPCTAPTHPLATWLPSCR
jgi:integrase